MALKREHKVLLGAGLGLAFVWMLFGNDKKKAPPFFVPGRTYEVIHGATYTVRLPRGRYESPSDEIIIVHQEDAGVSTDVTFQVVAATNDYTATALFLNEDDPTRQYGITLIARKLLPE